ncbi:PIG-L deacetylase family protein [Nocardia acidivorans]|uniref:PIG-L deacetylase family protein n=1 Tax=Nocardia acidivorans TaxID=404580 RepID=UPI00083689D9|nr:PIG-L family deacetylase [Nocardia acidivorans]
MAGPVIDVAARGLPEARWESWRRRCAPLRLPDWRELIVMAAHPDDEVLGAGGLIASARAAGIAVTIVTATDGEGSHPDSPTHSPSRLAALRIDEARSAASELNADPPVRLGLPDGGLAAHEDRLAAELRDLIGDIRRPGVVCAATWRYDGHPDHEAVGRAAAAACAATGTDLLHYPVWMWQWATPDHPLLRDCVPARLTLTPAAHAAKCRALECFRSQFLPLSDHPADAPIVPPHVLRRFTGPTETYLR